MASLRKPNILVIWGDDIGITTYRDWIFDHLSPFVPAQGLVARFLGTFQEFPPRQKAASFTIDQVVERMMAAASGGRR